ncbi:MAG: helix-turn-helix domain-containing protein [Clostridia bacterium]|nr:helix-turn-helix domain-containing protein [Clostridia bacterium]
MKKDIKIFIIDDEISIIESIAYMLSNKYYVTGSTSSLEGIEKIKSEHFDLLVLDYFIDQLNGNDIVEEIRKFNPDIYILLLTGYQESVPALQTLDELDIQSYCEKSADFKSVIVCIESAVKSVLHKVKSEISFSERLKELRDLYGTSQKELGEYVGVGRTSIANYEAGISEPSIDSLKKIAQYFGVTIDYLLCYSIDKSKSKALNGKK